MIAANGTTSMWAGVPRPAGAAAHSRNSRYAVVRSPGTATVAPARSARPAVSTSGPHPRPSAPPAGSSAYSPSSQGSTAYDTLTTSYSPRSAAPLATSTSANVTATRGAPGSSPADQAWKTNVSFGHGEWASERGGAGLLAGARVTTAAPRAAGRTRGRAPRRPAAGPRPPGPAGPPGC